ncbi:hypothetical protein L596_007595 [Steinernema carpocapsae]|uniref:Ribosomal protein S36, mitochondrial n=1 Tax=Steinernema carpocapsae TaxID=34508 RepID=A0A4U5PAT6_STECR|nr:hypothetical protein L596_007595 [Steinernema carpocapsae]
MSSGRFSLSNAISALFRTNSGTSTSLDSNLPTKRFVSWLLRLFTTEPPKPIVSSTETQPAARMHFSAIQRTAVQVPTSRVPLIKFIGARLPRPCFDSSKLPPVPKAATALFTNQVVSAKKPSAIGPVGKIPRGSGIEESQLPLRFRRRFLDEEEIAAINNGGAYGL